MKKKQTLTLAMIVMVFMMLLLSDLLLWLYLDYSRVDPPRLPATITKVDAITVLAGGSGRIRRGYDLLQEEKADFLLIIGANPRSRSRDILTSFSPVPGGKINLRPNKVIIENRSRNTLTNIFALRDICRQHHFHSLVIVTSTFHLKRAYHLCRRILPPQLKVYYQTILPKNGTNDEADQKIPTTLRIKEFIKYLNALLLQLIGHD